MAMNETTLSLVKLAQEVCNGGKSPRDATALLLAAAGEHDGLAYLLDADQEAAITELERRFSGLEVKPWDEAQCDLWVDGLHEDWEGQP